MLTSTLINNLTLSIYIRSDPVPVDPDVVKKIFLEGITQQYFNVALTSALLYHSLITIGQEVKYFWPRPLNSISLIYFANRYIGLLGALSDIVVDGFKENILRCVIPWKHGFTPEQLTTYNTSCESSFWMAGLCNLVTIVLIDYILVVRVLALYHQDRRLAIFLKLLICVEAAVDFSLFIHDVLSEEIVAPELAEGITVCGALRGPAEVLGIISWVVPMTFGLFLLGLSLYKAAEYWRLSSGFKGFYLVKVLIRDQALYYGCVILCSILKIGAIHVVQFNVFVGILLNATGSPTLLCILGGQLLINLKEAGELGVNGGTNYRSKTVSDIEFAEGAPREEGQMSENTEDVPSFEDHSSA